MTQRWARAVAVAFVLTGGLPCAAWPQTLRGTVFDQHDLPVPGATVQLLDGNVLVTLVMRGARPTCRATS